VQLLMREVNHRAKNMLSVVDAIAHQTATKTRKLSSSASPSASRRFQPIKTCWYGVSGAAWTSRT